MTRKKFFEKYQHILEENEVLLTEGFDSALIGLDMITNRAIYDSKKMIEILVKKENMTLTEAVEYLEYNTWYAYVGDKTPIFLH